MQHFPNSIVFGAIKAITKEIKILALLFRTIISVQLQTSSII
jgi:hypothetical protein